jgi:hypothetical protein
VGVDFGTDAGSARLLESLGKGFTVDDVRRASDACRAAGMDVCHSLVFGGPGESDETIRETVDLMDTLAPRAVLAMVGLRIYPGTRLERIARADGSIDGDGSLLDPRFYFGGRGPGWLLPAVAKATAGRLSWFFPGERDWSASVGPKLLRRFNPGGPTWRGFRERGLWAILYPVFRDRGRRG